MKYKYIEHLLKQYHLDQNLIEMIFYLLCTKPNNRVQLQNELTWFSYHFKFMKQNTLYSNDTNSQNIKDCIEIAQIYTNIHPYSFYCESCNKQNTKWCYCIFCHHCERPYKNINGKHISVMCDICSDIYSNKVSNSDVSIVKSDLMELNTYKRIN